MSDNEVVRSQCKILLQLQEKAVELFGKNTLQFFKHRDQPEIFIIQIRKAHLVDIGSLMMTLSYHIKEQYDVFQGVAMREQLNMPDGGFSEEENYEYAFKHIFLRFKWHPKLQRQIFSSPHLKEDETYQNIKRLPRILKDVLSSMENETQQDVA